MSRLVVALALLGAAAAASAQEVTSDQITLGTETIDSSHVALPDGEEAKLVTTDCTGGIVYDDGGFNDAYALGPGQSRIVQKFDLPVGTTSLDQACICMTRNSAAPSSVPMKIVFYNDNGIGGAPGTPIAETVAVTINSIPIFPALGFYNFNLVGSGLVLPDTGVFVGADWLAQYGGGGAIFMCGDRSGTTTQRTLYGSGNGGSTFSTMATLFPTASPRAMGIRVDPSAAIAGCTPSATQMCLNNNRFRVSATFSTLTQTTTAAQVVKLTDDSGYLWFFNSANIELVVKVLNACGVNNRYWVFAAGLTNVRVDLTVVDTLNPLNTKTYTNLQNTPYQPLQDTNAFATCP